MLRRHFLQAASLSAAALAPRAAAGQFTGRIRKSLKWNMVTGAKGQPLEAAFRRLRECGFDGVEPSLSHVTDEAAWLAASRASGLVIDGTVGARTEALGEGIELTRRLGGDSMLVVARYDQKVSLPRNWQRCRDQLREAAPLAERARTGKLAREDITGGTFTVSNLGMFGIDRFDAIINPPQVGILAVGAARERVIARDGAAVVAKVATLTLSADHRVVDGAVGAAFLADLRTALEAG